MKCRMSTCDKIRATFMPWIAFAETLDSRIGRIFHADFLYGSSLFKVAALDSLRLSGFVC